MNRSISARVALAAVAILAGATVAGAIVSERVFGLVPCKLCLLERQPYYVGVPLALVLLLASPRGRVVAVGASCLALVFAVGAMLGAYHAGAEWGWWPGPSDCGGGLAAPADVGDLLASLARVRVVSCTDAAWRFAGLSLAGWNAAVSLALAAGAAWAARTAWRDGPEPV